jgi:uncharacterized membrane protein YbhN (UPF0104 family)
MLAGFLLMWAAFSQVSIQDVLYVIGIGNYEVAAPVLVVSFSGYIFRVMRWQIMLKQLHEHVDKKTLLASLCIGYGVNYAVPRLGELTRCALLRKSHRLTLDKSLLSVAVERFVDTICLFILLGILVLLYSSEIADFMQRNIWVHIQGRFTHIHYYVAILCVCLLLVLLYFIYAKARHLFLFYKSLTTQLFRSLLLPSFWIYTSAIWICYYLMTYLWFFTFKETSVLTLSDAFFIMIIGSIGRSVPIQGGGVGAYHFLVAQACVLLGISLTGGNALAIVIHGIQSVFTLVLTGIAYIWYVKTYK